MKTTDSVKEKFIKWLAEESGEPEHLVMLMQSVYVNPESMMKFYSHSLAEARREWVEEMVKKIDKLQTQCNEADGLIDGITALHTLRSNLLTGDNPERKV